MPNTPLIRTVQGIDLDVIPYAFAKHIIAELRTMNGGKDFNSGDSGVIKVRPESFLGKWLIGEGYKFNKSDKDTKKDWDWIVIFC